MLSVLYDFPRELQRDQDYWRDPCHWPPLLPDLGRLIDPVRLVEDQENNGKANNEAETIWVSQHLNIEIGVGQKTDAWAEAETLMLEHLFEVCDVIVVALDGGGLDHLYGVAVLGRERETRRWLSWSHAWCHEGVLERRQSIASRLLDFREAGELTMYKRTSEDLAEIVELIADVLQRGPLAAVAKIDPWAALMNGVMSRNPEARGNSGWTTDNLDGLMAKIDAVVDAMSETGDADSGTRVLLDIGRPA